MKLAELQPLEPFSQETPSLLVLRRCSFSVVACSCSSFWRSQNLRIPFDAQYSTHQRNSSKIADSRLQNINQPTQSHI